MWEQLGKEIGGLPARFAAMVLGCGILWGEYGRLDGHASLTLEPVSVVISPLDLVTAQN
jgi:hypothetical protein